MSHLHSNRLRLVPATADTTAMELAAHDRLGVILGCAVPTERPPVDMLDVLAMFEATLRNRPAEVGWWAWYFGRAVAGPRPRDPLGQFLPVGIHSLTVSLA